MDHRWSESGRQTRRALPSRRTRTENRSISKMIARAGLEAMRVLSVIGFNPRCDGKRSPAWPVTPLAHYAPWTRGTARSRPSPEIIRRDGPRGCQKTEKKFLVLGHLGFRDNEGIQTEPGLRARRSFRE